MTVWDQAQQWAYDNFETLDGQPYKAAELQAECQKLLNDFPGIATRRWLFVYSPASVNELFEVSHDAFRMMMAFAKLQSVADGGGMIFGADFSKPPGKILPLVVCKPVEVA